jgi:hypothetical protein
MTSAMVLVAPASRAGDPTMADCIRANEMSISLRGSEHLREAHEQLLVCAARTCPDEVRAAAGVALGLFAPSGSRTSLRIVPAVAEGSGGVWVSGVFR